MRNVFLIIRIGKFGRATVRGLSGRELGLSSTLALKLAFAGAFDLQQCQCLLIHRYQLLLLVRYENASLRSVALSEISPLLLLLVNSALHRVVQVLHALLHPFEVD